jgi:hypothetical protein
MRGAKAAAALAGVGILHSRGNWLLPTPLIPKHFFWASIADLPLVVGIDVL